MLRRATEPGREKLEDLVDDWHANAAARRRDGGLEQGEAAAYNDCARDLESRLGMVSCSCRHTFVKELRPVLQVEDFPEGAVVESTPAAAMGDVALLAGNNRYSRLHWCIGCGALVDEAARPVFVPTGRST